MLTPLKKSTGHTHADARGFSAAIVERYKMLHKRAHLVEEGGGGVRAGTQVEDSKLHCNGLLFFFGFFLLFQVVPSQRHWN